MKKFIPLVLSLFLSLPAFAQDYESPYETDFLKDGAWITGAVGLNVLGFHLIQNKDYLTEAEVNALDKNDVWKIDRWAAGNYNPNHDELSYIPFYASFALPLAFLPSDAERHNFGQIAVLFVETMATTGAAFTITAGAIDKPRPLVYNENIAMSERTDKDAQRSFIGGHSAATSAALFFSAKIFNDFHPDSRAIPYVWGSAAAISGLTAYWRTTSGKHFLTDNLAGLAVGAAVGILIPEIHKKGSEEIDLYPTSHFNINGTGINSRGLAIRYTF